MKRDEGHGRGVMYLDLLMTAWASARVAFYCRPPGHVCSEQRSIQDVLRSKGVPRNAEHVCTVRSTGQLPVDLEDEAALTDLSLDLERFPELQYTYDMLVKAFSAAARRYPEIRPVLVKGSEEQAAMQVCTPSLSTACSRARP